MSRLPAFFLLAFRRALANPQLLTTRLFLPYPPIAASVVPPFVVVMPWVAAGEFVLVLSVHVSLLLRVQLGQVLRLGEAVERLKAGKEQGEYTELCESVLVVLSRLTPAQWQEVKREPTRLRRLVTPTIHA